MRVLLANKFYYRRGGDCVYSIELENLLKAAGHEVAFFAMDYPENLDSSWKNFWPSEVAFSPKKPVAFFKAFKRPFGDGETVKRFTALLDSFKPDVLHLNNIHTQLSPVIAEIAHSRGLKVVWTLHDYKLVCPAYTCLSNGKVCEDCIAGQKSSCTSKKCLKNSWLASKIAEKEAVCWNRTRLEKCVDKFICPSHFMKAKMEQGGFDASKLVAIHNFVDEAKFAHEPVAREKSYCYVGRLSSEKGAETLLQVASKIDAPLYVLGTGPLEAELKSKYARANNIRFMGHCDWEMCKSVLLKSRFSVVPSEWYENNPFSVIEPLCLGTPVLGADVGGIPELIEPGKTGDLFKMGDALDLETKIRQMLDKDCAFDVAPIRRHFSKDNYLEQMMSVYG